MRNGCLTFRTALFATVLLCWNITIALTQSPSIDVKAAAKYFQEAREAADRDGGRLWGRSLNGPILFVDPITRQVVANQGDTQGLLTPADGVDGVFVGRLPVSQPLANATMTWGGVRWATILWLFVTPDPLQHVKLMIHESFHRIQNELKFPLSGAINNHLDLPEGRLWLQLEWRALRKALVSRGKERQQAVEDALTFRHYRRSLFTMAEASERGVEMYEGLAEYTGYKLAGGSDAERVAFLSRQFEWAAQQPSFVVSFAYTSGPAYGLLLDADRTNWRKGLTPGEDLGALLQSALKIKLPKDLEPHAEQQALLYDGEALRTAEAEREAMRQKRIADYRKRFVEGPTLRITLTDKRSVTINTTNMVPLEGVGIVYPTARVTDAWGVLEVSNGALMVSAPGGRITDVYITPPVDPQSRSPKGDGWTLQLDPGWEAAAGPDKGCFVLKKRD